MAKKFLACALVSLVALNAYAGDEQENARRVELKRRSAIVNRVRPACLVMGYMMAASMIALQSVCDPVYMPPVSQQNLIDSRQRLLVAQMQLYAAGTEFMEKEAEALAADVAKLSLSESEKKS